MNDYINIFKKKSCFRIADFDERAAIEVALIAAADRAPSKKKKVERTDSIAKVKYDRQIAAIAKVEGATSLYTDDENLTKVATRLGIKVISIADLELPPEDNQMSLQLNAPDPSQQDEDE